jgi:multidrug efflux pump subunit AcrB
MTKFLIERPITAIVVLHVIMIIGAICILELPL